MIGHKLIDKRKLKIKITTSFTLILNEYKMGQKVHPLGFRVGITKKHQSQWYARFDKNLYAQSVVEDKMLRNTLIKLFPELLNPIFKKIQNRQQERKITPKISQIKIERGLIPYEIGIQIHAENCELIKWAIDKLKIDRDLACYLQKTQKFLIHIGQKAKLDLENFSFNETRTLNLEDLNAVPNATRLVEGQTGFNKKKSLKRVKKRSTAFFGKKNLKKRLKRGSKLPKSLFEKKIRRKKLIQRRLKKRQNIRARFYKFIAKGLFIKKRKNLTNQAKTETLNRGSCLAKQGTKALAELSLAKQPLHASESSPLPLASEAALRDKGQQDRRENSPKKIRQRFSKIITYGNKNKNNFIQRKIKALRKFKALRFKTRQKNGGLQNQNQKFLTVNGNFGKQKRPSSLKSSKRKPQTKIKSPILIRIRKKIQKKFLKIYLKKMNKHFLKQLKKMMQNWIRPPAASESHSLSYSSMTSKGNNENIGLQNSFVRLGKTIGYRQKWDINFVQNTYKKKPITKLIKLVKILKNKINKKLQALKKDFVIFGNLSKTQAYNFYQILIFFKSLKQLIRERFIKLRLNFKQTKMSPKIKNYISGSTNTYSKNGKNNLNKLPLMSPTDQSRLHQSTFKTKKVLLKMVNNLRNECRKIKFIEYLKQIVKNHRSKNIFYYLSILSKANKDLKQAKNFTIKKAPFLFGLDLQNPNQFQEANFIKNQVTKVLEQLQNKTNNGGLSLRDSEAKAVASEAAHAMPLGHKARDSHALQAMDSHALQARVASLSKAIEGQDFQQALRESLINQIEQKKLISRENLKLTPKISIKFYSVKKQNLQIKALFVAESIIDALEKRKAFRKVIKMAKVNLMKTQRVKGVKIQVAGRLNGAEIARTEWVRAGRVPLQTLRANIDFSYQTANTIYGIIGVKVWIFKGYVKTMK